MRNRRRAKNRQNPQKTKIFCVFKHLYSLPFNNSVEKNTISGQGKNIKKYFMSIAGGALQKCRHTGAGMNPMHRIQLFLCPCGAMDTHLRGYDDVFFFVIRRGRDFPPQDGIRINISKTNVGIICPWVKLSLNLLFHQHKRRLLINRFWLRYLY